MDDTQLADRVLQDRRATPTSVPVPEARPLAPVDATRQRLPMPYERQASGGATPEEKRAEAARLRAIQENPRAALSARARAGRDAEELEREVYIDEATFAERAVNALKEAGRGAAQSLPDVYAGLAALSEQGMLPMSPGFGLSMGLGESANAPITAALREAAGGSQGALDELIRTDPGLTSTPEAVVFNALGSTAPYFLAGAVAGKAGSAGLGALTNGGRGYHDALAAGADPAAASLAFMLHSGVGASEAIPVGRAFERMQRATGGRLAHVVQATLAEGGEELVQETFQTLSDDTVAKVLYDVDRRIGERIEEAMLGGASAGAILGALTAAIGGRRGGTVRLVDFEAALDQATAPEAVAPDATAPEARTPGIVRDVDGERLAAAEAAGDTEFLRRWQDPPERRIRLEVGERQTVDTPTHEPLAPEATPTDATIPDGSPDSERPLVEPAAPDAPVPEAAGDPDPPGAVGTGDPAGGVQPGAEDAAGEDPGDDGAAESPVARPKATTALTRNAPTAASIVVMEVRDMNGELLGFATEPHDGTPESIRAASMRLRERGPELDPEWSNANSRTVASDEFGTPNWTVSPNGNTVAEIGTPAAAQTLGAEPEPTPAPEASGETGESRVATMPIRSIEADPARFQPRDDPYSEESVQRIVDRFDERELDPLRVWTDPTDGKTYVLAGHSRREGIRRLQQEGRLPEDYQVPIDPYEGTEAEARDFAGRENSKGTAQTANEDAAALRVATEGMSRTKARAEATARYGRNGSLVYALSRLSPTGKAVQDLRAFGKARTKEARDVTTMAQWLGLARDRHEALTDSHERELYDHLKRSWGKRSAPRTQNDWLQFVDEVLGRRSFMGEFDASKPLNLSELPADATADIDAAIVEADKELKTARREREQKEKEFIERGASGARLKTALKPFDDAVRAAQREAIRVREEAGRARTDAKKQASLFGDSPVDLAGPTLSTNTNGDADDAATANGLERPGVRTEGPAGDPVGELDVRATARPGGRSTSAPGTGDAGGVSPGVASVSGADPAGEDGGGVSGRPATPDGARGDRGVRGDEAGPGGSPAADPEPGRGRDAGAEGVRPERDGSEGSLLDPAAAATDADEHASGIDLDGTPRGDRLNPTPEASGATTKEQRRKQQAEADKVSRRDGVTLGDADDVRRSLPMLLDEQKEDVVKAERRFFGEPTEREKAAAEELEDPRKGMMFTNATGTGKTYTGLGVVKRFVLDGREDVLIVVPTDQKAKDWIEDARNLSIDVTQLEGLKDGGSGVVVTTYANLSQNNALRYAREFDLVLYDESHRLVQNQNGDRTAAQDAHEAVTNRPDSALQRVVDSDAATWAALEVLQEKKRVLAKFTARERREESPAYRKAYFEEMEAYAAYDKLASPRKKDPAVIAQAEAAVRRTRAVFLSATPFAYHKTLQYADGYLFASPVDKETEGQYNSAQGFDLFLRRHLGYHMRTGRLNAPPVDVDQSFMERELHGKLEASGAVSGRALEMEMDYSRDFFEVESKVGQAIDEGLQFLWGNTDLQKYGAAVRRRFGFLYKTQLLEGIKARESVSRVKQHLALGRKVVVFHQYNENRPIHPFRMTAREAAESRTGDMAEKDYQELKAQIERFRQEKPDLWNLDLRGLQPAQVVFEREFGDQMATFNGTVPKRQRAKNVKRFNLDGSGLDVLVVQMEAGKEGISLHDTTGGHRRVVINLGLPTKPTDAIQTEGRVYRFGNATDAVFEYPVTGLAFERDTFGQKVATRSKTAENLALGVKARDLEAAFRDGYANASDAPPSDAQGKGGKEADRFVDTSTPFDRAKTLYYARGKTSKRNKSREGIDYFATPEPIGLKLVEWLQMRRGEQFLEPSAGHGAIARFAPEFVDRVFIEPSYQLAAKLRLYADGTVWRQRFEDLNVRNKFDGIAMNPPYGSGGKTAMEHVAKALRHLRPGGRLIAIIPDGPAMGKRLAAFEASEAGAEFVKVADVGLPSVTFKRAATEVRTRVVVFDRPWSKEDAVMIEQRGKRDVEAETIEELFDRLEHMTMPGRRPRPLAPEAGPKPGAFDFETLDPGDRFDSRSGDRSVSADTSTPEVRAPEASADGPNVNKSVGEFRDVEASGADGESTAPEAPASRAPATLDVMIDGKTFQQELGGLDTIRSVEMPELIRMARQLMGDVPHLSKKMGEGTRGQFGIVPASVPSGAAQDVDARGGRPKGYAQIKLRPELFRDPTLAAQVLAHEVGHLVDFMPDYSMKRGNLGGRLRALRGHMMQTVERAGGRSKGPALTSKDRARLRYAGLVNVLARHGHSQKEYRENEGLRQSLQQELGDERRRLVQQEIVDRRLIQIPALTDELWAFSQYWRPMPADPDPTFLAYRKSSVELFADAIGGLLIAPTELKKRAPTFYQAFFEGLAEDRPNVAQAYEEIQLLLARGPEALAQARMEDAYGMFDDADRRKLLLEETQRAQRKKDYRTQLVQTLVTRWHPILERAKKAEASGAAIPADKDPRYLLEEMGMADSPGALYVADVAEKVLDPLKTAGLTERDLAVWMFLNRVEKEREVRITEEGLPDDVLSALAGSGLLARESVQASELEDLPDEIRAIVEAAASNVGGRAAMANPLGFTEETARTTLAHLETMLGEDGTRAIRRAQRVFVDLTTPILDEAAELGILNKLWWKEAGRPNRYAYATFRVLDFVDDPVYVGVGAKKQQGTFRDVDDVFSATMGKALSTIRENATQRAKLAVSEMMAVHFSDEWERPQQSAPGRYAPSRKKLKGVVWIWENGKKRPYYADRYVADSFTRMNLNGFRWLTAGMRLLNAPFRAGYITYNLTFGLWTNPIRDLRRATKALAIKGRKASYRQVVKRYLTESKKAWTFARGRVSDPGVRELLASGAVMPPGESVMFVDRGDGLRKTAERYGMAPPQDRHRLLGMLDQLGASVRMVNRFTEALPKFAAWRVLEENGIDGRERAWRVRTQVGTPNVTDGGRAKELTNSIFMFSNVFTQGWRSDAQLATRPETRSGFWFRTMVLDGLPKIAMAAAASGLLAKLVAQALDVPEDDEEQNVGAWLKTFYDHVGSYDMGSYMIVPLGYAEDASSPTGRKARYLRIPHDESARAGVGALWRLLGEDKDALGALSSAFDFGGGQIPGVAPAIGLGSTWAGYLGGANPRDDFYQRDIISRRAQSARLAGDHMPALREMLGHTVDEFGVTRFQWRDKEGINAVPFLNRVVKESSWGVIEADRRAEDAEAGQKASVRLSYDEATQDRQRELSSLRLAGEEKRERQGTQERYTVLLDWNREAYRFYDELAQAARTDGDREGERQARRALEAATKEFFPDE